MKGLLKNNFYAALSSARVFSVIMLFLGIFVVVMDNTIPSLLTAYMVSAIIGFSANGIFALERENTSGWWKYKLNTPVSRKEIVGSYFIGFIPWLFVGIAFAGVCTVLSIVFHGFPFDRSVDVPIMFAAGISVSLFMGGIFFPLFYLGGDSVVETVFLALSLFSGIGIVMGIVSLLNRLFGQEQTMGEILIGVCIMIGCGILAFVLSYPLSVRIFRRKE